MQPSMAKAAHPVCDVYCRICGVPRVAFKGLKTDHAIQMEWWELDNLIKGAGCPACHGVIPKYITDMPTTEGKHVMAGLTIQWMESVRRACPKAQPYPQFPEPEVPDFFLWTSPTVNCRFAALGPEIDELVRAIEGGPDELRIHPESKESEFEDFQYGLWHVISDRHASLTAETSSTKYLNAVLLNQIFNGKTDLLHDQLWILIGHDRAGVLTLDEQTLSKIAVVEAAIRKFGCLTQEIYGAVLRK